MINTIEEIKESLLSEMKDILEELDIEWTDEFLSPRDYTPDFDFGNEDEAKWFYITLGKYLQLCEIEGELLQIIN